ncbi:protoporphyrinogen/coproporphyrinogen oxidase [Gryllotalpicola ginsengisoli]|uniref:protoporphyrinogen/coproporphyrinogen oxidase n=1 Tax=Gryllotalpicola ginsengisoli TaxID=444608 RepID=UPI00040FBF10|nr:FAD-dependent oxidoreductase [Gryllotalpicola ginsengisoli]
MTQVRFLVIGAGPTGVGAAARLVELGEDHLVVDSADRVGGAAASVIDDAGFTWDLGGHVIHSHFAAFDDAVASSGVALNRVERAGRVFIDGCLVPAPIQQQLDALPADLRPEAPAANLAEYYRNCFGDELYRRFFAPFNRKMWTAPLELVDHDWTSLRSGSAAPNVPALGLARDFVPARETFPYPVGGTGALWQGIAERLLDPHRLRLGARVVSVDVPRRRAVLDDGQAVDYEFCISSAPVTAAAAWAGRPDLTAGLRASRVLAVGLGFDGVPPEPLAAATWIYSPDADVPWYRLTVLSNYDQGLAGSGRWSVLGEVPLFPGEEVDVRAAVEATVGSVARLAGASVAPVSTWTRKLSTGYPVPTLGRDVALRAIDELLSAHGFFSRGRFGGWRYESCNQDYAYQQGRDAVDAALGGAAEDAYWRPERFRATELNPPVPAAG